MRFLQLILVTVYSKVQYRRGKLRKQQFMKTPIGWSTVVCAMLQPALDARPYSKRSELKLEKGPLTTTATATPEIDINVLTPEEIEMGRQAVLIATNKLRQLHNAPPLTLDPVIHPVSQDWARFLAVNRKFEHRRPNKYGESIAYGTGRTTVEDLVQGWYDEVHLYNFATPGFALPTGHFTALVWKKTQRMGAGVYKTVAGTLYLVANYEPSGNAAGKFVENVTPLGQLTAAETKAEPNVLTPLELEECRKKVLEAINKTRELHNAPPLTLDPVIDKYAQEWSDHLAKNYTFEFRDIKTRKYGENLGQGDEKEETVEHIVRQWSEQVKNYNFEKAEFVPFAGLFTQMVWKDSKRLGVGVYKTASGRLTLVANFDPPGNYTGEFKKNVKRQGKLTAADASDVLSDPFSQYRHFSEVNVLTPAELEQGRNAVLEASNKYRQLHNAPPLTLDSALNKCAQEWAEHCGTTSKLECQKASQYGQNLGMAFGIPVEKLIQMWWDENKHYNFANPAFSMASAHFSQLVWKNSQRLGVGLYKTASGKLYLIANYDPSGNISGQYVKNVVKKQEN